MNTSDWAILMPYNQYPAADVVEVVRCKDCRWFDKGENESDYWSDCTLNHPAIQVGENDYCSKGFKPKDKDGD